MLDSHGPTTGTCGCLGKLAVQRTPQTAATPLPHPTVISPGGVTPEKPRKRPTTGGNSPLAASNIRQNSRYVDREGEKADLYSDDARSHIS